MRRGMQVWHFPGGFFIAESARNHILHVSGSTFSAANYPGTLLYLASGRKDGLTKGKHTLTEFKTLDGYALDIQPIEFEVLREPGCKDHILFCFSDSIAV